MIDGHSDTLSRITSSQENLSSNSGHFDLERAKAAGIQLQFMSLYTNHRQPGLALEEILRQIDYFERQMDYCHKMAYLRRSYQDIETHFGQGRVGIILHLEGAEALGKEIFVLRTLYRLGVRSMGLTWNNRNLLADGVMDARGGGGLSELGCEVVREMNRIGMIVDLAHISPAGFFDVLNCTNKPPIVSHANAAKIFPHPRNLSDEQMVALAKSGGVLGATFVPDFISSSSATIGILAEHICYMIEIMGEDHVVIGSDFDGTDIAVIPGVEGIADLASELTRSGLSPVTIEKVLKGNYLRILKELL